MVKLDSERFQKKEFENLLKTETEAKIEAQKQLVEVKQQKEKAIKSAEKDQEEKEQSEQ